MMGDSVLPGATVWGVIGMELITGPLLNTKWFFIAFYGNKYSNTQRESLEPMWFNMDQCFSCSGFPVVLLFFFLGGMLWPAVAFHLVEVG